MVTRVVCILGLCRPKRKSRSTHRFFLLGHTRGGKVDSRPTKPDSFLIDAVVDAMVDAVHFICTNVSDLSYNSFWPYDDCGIKVNYDNE